MWDQDQYIKAWNFATKVHNSQQLPGTDLPYINHLGLVTMEVLAALPHSLFDNPTLAMQCALLHDTIEDCAVSFEQLKSIFGEAVAEGVQALSKNRELGDKATQMQDSLQRIKRQPIEIALVKLADRTTNLQPPPSHWSAEKCLRYCIEAQLIHDQLGDASPYLAARLSSKITNYQQYCCTGA
ncbi:MAG: hypothetical protein OFPII_12290 [Osedax symbiont Rs1]|nr:MAG: hypothetical protein OFPII_12290 [Osedax symbiont Rs1]